MGCRKYRGEAFFDDLTGETHLPEELEEMAFAFDGQALIIDLSDENAAAFREAMAPFVRAARPASKSKVLATLPKRERRLKAVPDVPVSPPTESASEPESEPQDAPISPKGEEFEPLSEPEGNQVPEAPSDASDSSFSRPALTVVPVSTPDDWAPWAPTPRDDKPERVRKARNWLTAQGRGQHEVLTPKIFAEWEEFYQRQKWRDLE